ncbi:MAG TPA: TetR family transcriptional regulator [Pseudonocardia sp.]|uniref:TetR/AcrR family transcriptional regulator n=1 Tax=Pseudonocardia sp. TaxID=60912 RepID=UPI002F42F390
MSGGQCGFRRARRPEQVEARRTAILDAAVVMLRERPVADISLRELSERVGLAKSNVLRYFDSREAIFLEVLDRSWTAWLDGLAKEFATLSAPAIGYQREIELASSVATALIRDPLLCELLATMGGVLERNISVDFARSFKSRAMEHNARFAALVQSRLPTLSAAAVEHFAASVMIITSGLWPYSHPTEAVASVMAEFGSPPADQMFAGALTDGLANQLVGLAVRDAASD